MNAENLTRLSIIFQTVTGSFEPVSDLAEREGFEPSIELLTLYSLSRGAPSASRASLRFGFGVATKLSATAYRTPFAR